MKYFLDANVLIHYSNDLRKQKRIDAKIERIGVENIVISSITLYELHTKLIKAKVSPANVKALADAITVFQVRNFNTGAAKSAAKVRAELENIGQGIGHPDQLLAGHVKFERATLVTNNVSDFEKVHGLKFEDWIEE